MSNALNRYKITFSDGSHEIVKAYRRQWAWKLAQKNRPEATAVGIEIIRKEK